MGMLLAEGSTTTLTSFSGTITDMLSVVTIVVEYLLSTFPFNIAIIAGLVVTIMRMLKGSKKAVKSGT